MSAPARIAGACGALTLGCALVLGFAGGQDFPGEGKAKKDKGDKEPKADKGGKWDKVGWNPEDKAVYKTAEKAVKDAGKAAETERDKWLKEMNKAYPGRVSPGLSDADFAQWFGLLSAGSEWRREDVPTKQVGELFDRAAERSDLGGAAALRRNEFLDYARRFLVPGFSPPWKPPADPFAEADKVFRQLDRDQSGFLEPAEWPDRLREAASRVDRDRDGRISPDEYRPYFEGRVATAIEFGPEPPSRPPDPSNERPPGPIRPGRLPPGLPAWFAERDLDGDGQIALHEWRRAGLPLEEFFVMDLDGDGLLPPDEYLRFLRLPRPAPDPADLGDWLPAPRGGR